MITPHFQKLLWHHQRVTPSSMFSRLLLLRGLQHGLLHHLIHRTGAHGLARHLDAVQTGHMVSKLGSSWENTWDLHVDVYLVYVIMVDVYLVYVTCKWNIYIMYLYAINICIIINCLIIINIIIIAILVCNWHNWITLTNQPNISTLGEVLHSWKKKGSAVFC